MTSTAPLARSASATRPPAGHGVGASSRWPRSSAPASSSWSATTTQAGCPTYAQAGQDFGYSLLWTLLLLVPVLIVNQEMVVRLGAVTGVGQARLIKERFGSFWAWFSVGGLFLLNFLIISTEFIGVTLAAEYFGFSRYLVVPLAALVLVAITVTGNFRRWERAMFVFLFASLLVLPLAVLSHPDPGAVLRKGLRSQR